MDSRLDMARAKLERRLLGLAPVRLIDIGRERDAGPFFLRVHLQPGTDPKTLGVPTDVDGVPVRVLFGDYRLG